MHNLSHRERIENTIDNSPVDCLPVSFWRHFPVDDQCADRLAKATKAFQDAFNLDIIKVSPSSSFCLSDWGARDQWKGNPEGTREYLQPVIKSPEDWVKLKPLNPKKGSLGRQLECLKLLKSEYHPKTPIIQTIFNPLSQAKNLVGKENLLWHLRMYPDLLRCGLDAILESIIRFIGELKKINIDGIFYAVQHASFNYLSEPEFHEYIHQYDIKALESGKEFWLKLLHLHGSYIRTKQFADYPVDIINWHDRETGPSLSLGRTIFPSKVLCGGLRRIETMVLGDNHEIKTEIDSAIQQASQQRLILGTGCVLPITTPYGNIRAVVDYARSK